MATTIRKKGNTGKRYPEEQRRQILEFVRGEGRGGIAAACKKYGVSYIALRRWMNGAAVGRGTARAEKAKGFDGRKLRRVRSAVATLRGIKKQVTTLQRALKQLLP